MVSFHSTHQCQTMPKNPSPDFESLSNKRKREDHKFTTNINNNNKNYEQISPRSHQQKSKNNINSLLGNDLPPLPLDWQRCLDIKSGQVYFYNTRTQEKTSNDPRLASSSTSSSVPKSLDLELNLLCGGGSSENNKHDVIATTGKIKSSGGFLTLGAPPPLEGGDQQAADEMMTAVCRKCHMLVMVFKFSPTCPNCKFVNHPDLKSPNLVTSNNQRPGLLC